MRSRLPFCFLRDGTGVALGVVESATTHDEPPGKPLMEWPAKGGIGADTRLHRDAAGAHLWIETIGCIDIDETLPSIAVPPLPSAARREELAITVPDGELLAWREVFILGPPAMLCFMARGYVPLHAASVDVGGEAILLGAPGTFGKTTLSGAFHNAGYRLLSDDISSCVLATGAAAVLPGPALLRLRRDVFDRLDFPDTEVAFETPLRVALSIAPSRRGDAAPVPLRAIVLLRRSEGEPHLARADPADAVRDLLALCFRGMVDKGQAFREITSLVNSVPVWNLSRPLEFAGLPELVEQIVSRCVRTR